MRTSGLPEGWRLSEEYSESKQADYVKQVTEEILAIPRTKIEAPKTFNGKPVADLSPGEREEFIFSLQPESTKAALTAQKTRKPDDDIDHLLRPLPPEEDWKREIEERLISPEEFIAHKAAQRATKNTTGQSIKGSVDSEKRQRGIEAFTYSKPANPSDADLKRLLALTPLKAVVASAPPKVDPRDYSWWTRLKWRLFAYEGESLESFGGRK